MKRKILSIMMCLFMLVGTFAGCGNEKENTANNLIEQENSGVSAETEQNSNLVVENESENNSDSSSTNESESSESEEPSESESDSQEPSKSESETTKPSEESSESQKPSKPSKPSKEEPSESESESKKPSKEEPYIVEYGYNEVTETFAYEKYGVKFYDRVHNFYNLYSNGSKVLVESKKSVIFDSTGYNATDEELLPETLEVAKNNKSLYEEALILTNEYRAEVSKSNLTLNDDLCKAATMRAIEMYYADYYAHNRADGRSCFEFDCFNLFNSYGGENIAFGYTTASSVCEGWRNSEGHYANMISDNYTEVGFGYFNGYWVQMFQ